MSTAGLFPETETTATAPAEAVSWQGPSLCKYGLPLVTVRLLPAWSPSEGWRIGWCAQVGKCVDEWHPAAPNRHREHPSYPWYRLDEMAASDRFAIAAGSAARALKIVLEQMLGYAEPELRAEVHELQEAIERQAQDWLCGRAAA